MSHISTIKINVNGEEKEVFPFYKSYVVDRDSNIYYLKRNGKEWENKSVTVHPKGALTMVVYRDGSMTSISPAKYICIAANGLPVGYGGERLPQVGYIDGDKHNIWPDNLRWVLDSSSRERFLSPIPLRNKHTGKVYPSIKDVSTMFNIPYSTLYLKLKKGDDSEWEIIA